MKRDKAVGGMNQLIQRKQAEAGQWYKGHPMIVDDEAAAAADDAAAGPAKEE